MLQGTFETLSLPEVLGLLASSRKTGALWLDAGPVTAAIHLADGHCIAVHPGDSAGAPVAAAELLDLLVEVCFEVSRRPSGSFRFADREPAPWSVGEPVDLGDVLVEVERLAKQWREIEEVIPSVECRPRLLDTLRVDEIRVDRARWELLVATDGRRTVRELALRSERALIDVCHDLLELVEAGAVGVLAPAAPAPVAPEPVAPAPAAPAPAPPEPAPPETAPVAPAPAPPRPAPVAPAPVVTNGHREPEPAEPERAEPERAEPERAEPERPARDEPSPDKGAFLRLFSGLRDG